MSHVSSGQQHLALMQEVYSSGQMAKVVKAGGNSGFMNFGFESFPGERMSFRKKQLAMVQQVHNLLGARQGDVIADLGCGKGGALRELLHRYPIQKAIGLNIDEMQLQQAAACVDPAIKSGRCGLYQHDLEKPFLEEDTLDGAYSIEVLSHINQKMAFFQNARRALKPNGRLVLAFIVLAKEWDLYDQDDQKYMRGMGDYFNEDPRSFLTRASYKKVFEEGGFTVTQERNISDQVYPHRHFEMTRVFNNLSSNNLIRRLGSRLYWKVWEGADPAFLARYLGDAIKKNQNRLYEYYLTQLEVNKQK